MKKNEYIEFIKTELNKSSNEVSVVKEKFHGPHWHLELLIRGIQVKIFGDIGFQLELKYNRNKFNIVQLDKALLGKQKTSIENIKAHIDSLTKAIKNENIAYEIGSMNHVCQELGLENTMDWGIINSDGSRVGEFISYIYQNKTVPFQIHYMFLELILASMNDSIVEGKCSSELKEKFYEYILPILGDKKYYPHVNYWKGISSEDEFPIGLLLIEYLKINEIDVTNW